MASLEYYKNIGMKYLVHLVDCEMLNNSYSQIVNYFNRWAQILYQDGAVRLAGIELKTY